MSVLQIRTGEERTAIITASLMLFSAAGSAVGGNATEALFFARFGTQQLPSMYILLGMFTFATSLVITAFMGRFARQRLYVVLPLILALLLIIEWLVVPLDIRWFFALIWLGMNVINGLLGLLTWGLASAVCDTRQAKRLFPLFSAGSITGSVLGGLITQPLANWLHASNLLLFWAGTLFAVFLSVRALIDHQPGVQAVSHMPRTGVVDEMQHGYRFVRRSPILRWISISAILFAVCFYALALPFSRGAAAQFSDADRLAGFLGQFQSLSTIAALLTTLLLGNRLFARFGIMPMLLVFPIIYLAGFAVLAIAAPFAMLVAVRFVQMAYMNGIAETAWQASFNVVPPEQRDQVRAFVNGVPSQAGTLIAGLILLIGEQTLQPQQLYLVGLASAALLVTVIWLAGRAYRHALVEALRAGRPQVFYSEEQPFAIPVTGSSRLGISRQNTSHSNAEAVSIAVRGLEDPQASIRCISAEIASHLPVPEAVNALVKALDDEAAEVRAAALQGLARAQAAPALLEIAACLGDPEPEVRAQAIEALSRLAASPRGVTAQVEPLLEDADALVRAQAALTLLRAAEHARAKETLYAMASGSDSFARARAITALGEHGDAAVFDLAVAALDDLHPAVRRAAAAAMASANPLAAVEPLIRRLDDADPSVRQALAASLSKTGEPALAPLLALLPNPSFADGVLAALEQLPVKRVEKEIRQQAAAAARDALRYHQLASGLKRSNHHAAEDDGRMQLLIESLVQASRRSGRFALRTLALVSARETLSVAIENVQSRDPAQRAYALETLEAVGEREMIRPLLEVWEESGASTMPLPADWLLRLLDDQDDWLRACAVLVAAQSQDKRLQEKLLDLRSSDPDETVRAVAENVRMGEANMETMPTLSIMERILFLRRVPLFADLPPADLKQVAAITNEVLFADGDFLARQDELGTEMFIVVSGEVRVLIKTENQGEPHEVACRRPGEYVGEMSLISQEPRIASLVADGQVRVLCLKQKQFESILRERPEISIAMIRVLQQRLKEASMHSI